MSAATGAVVSATTGAVIVSTTAGATVAVSAVASLDSPEPQAAKAPSARTNNYFFIF